MARGKKKEKELTPEEKLQQALVPVDEQPYEVPENWQYYRISGLVTHLKRGKAPKYVDKSDIPVFAQKCNQKDGTIAMEKAQFLNPETASRIKEEEFLKDEDVLINSTGTGTLGRVGYYRSDFSLPYQKVLPDSHMTVIRGIDVVSQNFLYYYLKSKQDYLEQQGVGTTNQKELRPEAIGNIVMPLPPLPEQQRIVDRIESLFAKLDEAKEKAQAVVEGFEDRKAAILHKAFTGELTERLRNKRGISLDSWESVTLNDVVRDFRYGTSEKSDYSFTGIPVFRIPNIGNGEIDFTDIKYLSSKIVESAHQICENDILIIRSNGSRDLVGKCALVPKLEREYAYASFLIRIRPSERVRAEYLVQFLNSATSRSQMFAKAKSSAGINNINSKELGAIIMKLPELWEQDEISRQASKLLLLTQQAKETAEQVIDQIDSMKKSILARAFRGELGTNDPTDESAEKLLKRILI